MGAKLLHLSQIAGHEIVTQLPCEYTFNAPEENNVSFSFHFLFIFDNVLAVCL